MPSGRTFDASLGIVLGSFDGPSGMGSFVWLSPLEVSAARPELAGHYGLILMVMGIKQGGKARAKRMPVPIASLHPGGVSDDPLCVYSLLVRLWHRRAAETAGVALLDAPLFAHANGKVVTTREMDQYAKESFAALGMPPSDTGGVAFRIGGATEVRQREGIERGKALVQERGRWKSDIHWIYQRGDVGEQLAMSIGMAGSSESTSGVATEALIPGWAQPAHRALH